MHILYLGNVLSKYGFTPTTIETLSERFKKDLEVSVASSKRNKLLRLLDMWRHIIVLKSKIDLVIIDTYSSSAFHFAWTSAGLCRLLNMPYIAYLHGGDLPKRFAENNSFSKGYLKNARYIVAPSGYLASATRKHLNLNAHIIPNYLDIESYPFKQRSQIEEINLLWVRSFHKIYQPELAIELVSLLAKRFESVKLTMVGPDKDGSLGACKNLAIELKVEDLITFTGRLSKEEWIARSAHHNVFLNTTSVDNTPVSVMEAMALGMPVVTTNVGGIPYLFNDGVEGIMVKEQTSLALAAAIENLINEPALTKAISKAARKRAEQWDWEVVRKQWLELLQKDIQ